MAWVRADGSLSTRVNGRLVEPGVHHQRHELHVLLARRLDDTRVDAARDDPVAVEREHLRRDDRDLVRVREEALHALLAPNRVPERLELVRRERPRGAAEQTDEEDGNQVPLHEVPRRCDGDSLSGN